MIASPLPLICTLLPMLSGLLLFGNRGRPNVRESISIVTSLILFVLVLTLYPVVLSGEQPGMVIATPIHGLELAFAVEPLGLLFATIASALWIPTGIYAIGYMRGNNEEHQTRFFFFFAFSIGATMGIAFSANLLTLFVFYELLTMATYPLVTHKGDANARQGGRIYLGVLLTTSLGFLIVALIWTWEVTGTLNFEAGGILRDRLPDWQLMLLCALYMFGIGKAALMPFHRWLPAAMVAPTPVSALLHAVAVVKAGVFTILKVAIYIFGIDVLTDSGASLPILWVAAFTMVASSVIALQQDNLKRRLAYSTISQLAYVTIGAMLATEAAVLGGAMQITMHAVGKITLFFCAGAIYIATHKTEISQMNGLGRRMPITFFAFLIGSLSIIGLPPFGGSWAKWWLITGALDAEQMLIVVLFMVSSLLNVAYLLPVFVRGVFLPPQPRAIGRELTGIDEPIHEAPPFCVVPLVVTASLCVVLFFYADFVHALMQRVPLGVMP
ncbi:proton-conducting transporter membrane subunit [Gammaproteobacteria bacterium]|nr:proton-conducting transporter membrane subunit [Gammaproteobacteria bacterium]